MTSTLRLSSFALPILGSVLLALGATACGDGDPRPYGLDVAATTPSTSGESNDEWLRKQQLLTVKKTYMAPSGWVTEEEEQTPNVAIGAIFDACVQYITASGCDVDRRHEVDRYLCIARTALALSTPQSDPITAVRVTNGPSTTYVFDKITSANAAEFAAIAADMARAALDAALSQLESPSTKCRPSTTWVSATAAQAWAASAVEAYHLGRAAYEGALEATLAMSDMARSSTASPTDAQARATVLEKFSRAAAAHLLVGGDDGLLGSKTSGYCAGSRLSPKAQSALQLLRDAAPSPTAILSATTTIQQLLNGTPTGDSVRKRLGAFHQIKQFGWNPTTRVVSGAAAQSTESYYELDESDFIEARRYLQQELEVFNRSRNARLVGVNGIEPFAGTAGRVVSPLPDGAWAARARYLSAGANWYDIAGYWPLAPNGRLAYLDGGNGEIDLGSFGSETYRTAPLNTFVGETYARIAKLLRTTTDSFSSAAVDAASQKKVLGLLGSITLGEEYRGAVELLVPTDRTYVRTVAHGYAVSDKVRAVVGEDGLRCAVEGNVEGAPCTDMLGGAKYADAACPANATTLSCLTINLVKTPNSAGAQTYFGTTGYLDDTRTLAPSVIDTLIANKTRIYFVKLKQAGIPEQPGNYEVLAGSPLSAVANGGTRWNIALPVVPTVDRRVADVLAPNRKNCVEQAVDCLGVTTDARLPLEDELTEDGNGFENSWRHYLALARQAADEAALLGREFRDAKLNKLQGDALAEQRREDQRQAAGNAIQEVQGLCGTALDTNELLDFLSGSQRDLQGVVTSGTSCSGGGKCAVPWTTWTADNISASGLDPVQVNRLHDCIDDSVTSYVPYVTLGDREFCIWGQGNNICPSSWATCYTSLPCTLPPGAPADAWVSSAKPLNYFTDPAGVATTGVDACRLLRMARGGHDPKVLGDMVATGVFNRERLRERVGKLGFKAEPGGFFTITQGGSPRLSSGHPTRGKASGWPWTGTASGCSIADKGRGLFCSPFSGTVTDEKIGAFNSRVYRAAFAGAAAIGHGLEVVAPSYEDQFNSTPCASGDHKTEYWISTARGTITTPLPVWTCKGRMPSYFDDKDRIKYTQSQQPRGSTGYLSWLTPDGAVSSANNFWGPAWPRCAWYGPDTLQGIVFGLIGMDTPGTGHYECEWGNHVPLSPFGDAEVERKIWAGLSTQQAYSVAQGRIYEVLRGINYEAQFGTTEDHLSTVFFEAGAANEALAKGQFTSIDGFNYYRIHLNEGAVLDGLELLCELDRMSDGPATVPTTPIDLTSVDSAAEALRKFADDITTKAARTFFARVPRVAADALGESGPTGAFPSLSGEMGEAVSNLRQSILSTQHALPVMANALRSLSTELKSLRVQLEINDAQRDLVDYDTLSAVLNQTTECALAATDLEGNFTSLGAAGAIKCANAAAQIVISLKKSTLQKDIIAGQDQAARLAFISRMSENATALEHAAIALMEARESVNANLSRIDGLKKRAKVSIARALYVNSYQGERQAAFDDSVGSLEALAKRRSDQALKNAKLMSWYAKRAIEQRLGVSLREMREDLPLVSAPALWEGEACTYSGFQDAEAIGGPASEGDWVAKFGNGFIGDYVTKLENFVESYRLSQNFHEGKDVAVISLRDDVANVRAKCSKPARNLFRNAGDLQAAAWAPRNCDPVTKGSVPVAGINCIFAEPLTAAGTPPNNDVPDLAVLGVANIQDSALGYSLEFGDGKDCNVADSGGCGWKPGSALSQIVHLLPGQYRVSWYTLDSPSAPETVINGAKSSILIVRPENSLTAVPLADSADTPDANTPFMFDREGSGMRWKRASAEFRITSAGNYEVGFGVNSTTRPPSTQQVTIGGPMLEAIGIGRAFVLGSFQETDADGMAVIANCEDTGGELFRLKHWKRACSRLCSEGLAANCKAGSEQCFREFNFGVSQAALQNGRLMNYSGFAKGNFNYRIDSVGINFVGSNVRNCEDSTLPSTCYNAAFVPYSLEHNGPFFVRNRAGDDFQALLFDGRIEHARGLALERYFTSPISSTDRDLMVDYMRTEFSGRPLDGNFTLRVWEDQGIDFHSIEDVQLVLNYRYWTAFD